MVVEQMKVGAEGSFLNHSCDGEDQDLCMTKDHFQKIQHGGHVSCVVQQQQQLLHAAAE